MGVRFGSICIKTLSGFNRRPLDVKSLWFIKLPFSSLIKVTAEKCSVAVEFGAY